MMIKAFKFQTNIPIYKFQINIININIINYKYNKYKLTFINYI